MDLQGVSNLYGANKQIDNIQPISVNANDMGKSVDVSGSDRKQEYLKLAVGVKEKELDRLGLTDEGDGIVTLKRSNSEKQEQQDGECETCANRKYQDGSDEMVSFKSASHIAPEAAASRVRAHEQEHVVNAYKKAEINDGKVVNASVAIHTSICPECGRTYVSGGTTTTTIRYNQDGYAENAKKQDETVVPGTKVDAKA